jgi:hypothetical protein
MRLRKWRIRGSRASRDVSGTKPANNDVKVAEPVGKAVNPSLLRKIISNPEFPVQLMMVMLTMSSGHIPMDRKIDTMSSTVETVRNITNLLTNTMQSLKSAAEAPQQIRRMLQ